MGYFMDRVAVFVDTGYVCTGGAMAIAGRKHLRSEIRIDVEKIFQHIECLRTKVSGLPLLRIYWYDGSLAGRMSTEQMLAARRNEIKLRLGVVNGQGEQKEVDTKLVTDLAELARNKAIADAILIAGDGDLRLGVELAQQHGVRVHLITIEGTGVSDPLKMEADTWTEVPVKDVGDFLSIVPSHVGHTGTQAQPQATPCSIGSVGSKAVATTKLDAETIVKEYLGTLSQGDRENLATAIAAGTGSIPADHNGRVLAKGRDSLNRELVGHEKSALRSEIKKQLGLLTR